MSTMQTVARSVVYREPARYAGWPANYGMWAWEDEIVLLFTVGRVKAGVPFHARDKTHPFSTLQARSLDGGHTWQVGPFPGVTPGGMGLSADEHMEPRLWAANHLNGPQSPIACPGGLDFSHPRFALLCARTHLHAGARSWFYASTNRCHTWQGPYRLPMFGQTGIAARTDYVIDDAHTCTLFLTAAKPDGQEGRVFCARTEDGGATFRFVSWVTPEPEGYTIMPASVRLRDGRLLTAVRCADARANGEHRRGWIDLYASDDGGAQWTLLATPVADSGRGGNPPALTQLADGRLVLTYGYRNPPYSIEARISADAGATWSAPLTLHRGAGNHDLGYPRTVARGDGALVTAYYFNDHPDHERYIAAVIWRP